MHLQIIKKIEAIKEDIIESRRENEDIEKEYKSQMDNMQGLLDNIVGCFGSKYMNVLDVNDNDLDKKGKELKELLGYWVNLKKEYLGIKAVREDFSNFVGLSKTINFDEMYQLENNYEK